MAFTSVQDLQLYRSDNQLIFDQTIRLASALDIPHAIQVNGTLHIDRNVVIEGDLEVEGDLLCRGGLWVKGSIRVKGAISTARVLRCDGDLRANQSIFSMRSIECKGNIHSYQGSVIAFEAIDTEGNIKASEQVEANVFIRCGGTIQAAWIFCASFHIECQSIRNRKLPLGREFWASLPPVAHWKELILHDASCWEDFVAAFEKEKASEAAQIIIKDNSWAHWSLIGQLRNFLGLTKTSSPEAF